MEQPATTRARDLSRPFVILGDRLVLSVDRAMTRFERAVEAHAISVRDAGRTISNPQIRVVEPMPIQEPVKIRGIKDDGTLPIEAKIAK